MGGLCAVAGAFLKNTASVWKDKKLYYYYLYSKTE